MLQPVDLGFILDLRQSSVEWVGRSILTISGAIHLVVLSSKRYSRGEVVMWRDAIHWVMLSVERSFCQQGRVVVWWCECREVASKAKCARVALVDNTYFTSSSHPKRDAHDLARKMDICHHFCKPRRRGHCSM